jgi:hypothetical protein
MNEHREGGQVLWSARTKGCLKPFNWSIINLNYRDYNTPSEPNMHARVKTMQKETSTVSKRASGRQQDSKNFF